MADDRLRPSDLAAIRDVVRQVERLQRTVDVAALTRAVDAATSPTRLLLGDITTKLDRIFERQYAALAMATRPQLDFERLFPKFTVPVVEFPAASAARVLDEAFGRVAADLAFNMEAVLASMVAPLQKVLEPLSQIRQAVTPQLTYVAEMFERFARKHVPANWSAVERDDVLELIRVHSVPLLDVPDAVTVQMFVAAFLAGEDPLAVFDVRRAEIIESLDALATTAAQEDDETVRRPAELLGQLVRALRAGDDELVLSGAAVFWENTLRDLVRPDLRHAGSDRLRERYTVIDVEEISFTSMRQSMVAHCAVAGLKRYRREKGDPIPGEMNRHGAVHTIDPTQYTARNALWATLLFGNIVALMLRFDSIEVELDDEPDLDDIGALTP